ncbi:MAG TPA: hypothetical protein VEZ51_07965, partial [Gemmatimonadaceae bacterium]|nr:hypothetical protein [Gemmatimonadaceae bacterium]
LDCLQIAASAIDLGFAVKALRSSPALLVANRTARYVMWTSVGVQGASALLISVDAIGQIARIVEDPSLSRGQKLSALTRLLATLIVTGALLALSYKSMGEAKARMKEHFGAKGEALKDLDAAALGLVDDSILKNLKAAGEDDLKRLAAMIREDPALVTRLGGTKNLLGALKGAKTNSAAELEARLFSQRLTAGGATGKSASRIADAVKAAGIDPAAAHLLTEDDIARLVKADASFAKARNLRDSDPVKASSTAAARAEMDGVTGVSSKTRDVLRAGIAHVHGMSDPGFSADPLAALRTRFPKIPPGEISALATLDRDALLALEAASESDVRAVINQLKKSSNADVQDLLKSFYYKQRKPARKEGEVYEPPTGIGDKLESSLDVLAKVRARGWPNGFGTRADFDSFIAKVKASLSTRGIPNADVRVHGSALHSMTPQDIDVAVLVDDATFNALGKRFVNEAPVLAKAAVKADLQKGKIASANFFPNVSPTVAHEATNVGTKLDAQVSVINRGSEFDLGPYFQ